MTAAVVAMMEMSTMGLLLADIYPSNKFMTVLTFESEVECGRFANASFNKSIHPRRKYFAVQTVRCEVEIHRDPGAKRPHSVGGKVPFIVRIFCKWKYSWKSNSISTQIDLDILISIYICTSLALLL